MSPTKFLDDDFDHHRRSLRSMREINGPRPSPLKINNDSHVIRKLPSSSDSLLLAHNKQQQQKQPVIIYTQSPKVIHTQPKDFMALVQKLTGLSGSADHETAPTTQARETMKKTMQKTSRDDHDNDSFSVLTDDQKRGVVADCGDNSLSSSLVTKAPTNPFLADMPLFTPTSTDNFFCSPRPMFRFPEAMFASPSTGNPISPSLIEFMKGLPEC